MSTTSEAPAEREWPITVVARWRDPGLSIGDSAFWLVLAAVITWLAVGSALIGGRMDWRAPLLILLVAASLGWRWVRRRPADLELELGPSRLRLRNRAANAFAEQLDRDDAGTLLAAEAGLDWHERYVWMTDATGRFLPRIRSMWATVEFADTDGTADVWWASTMPPGTSRSAPPTRLPVVGLLGAWWPRSDARSSVRGTLNVHRSWREAELASLPAWERRQRRRHGAALTGVMAVPLGLAILNTTSWTVPDLIVVGPLFLVGFGVGLWLLLR